MQRHKIIESLLFRYPVALSCFMMVDKRGDTCFTTLVPCNHYKCMASPPCKDDKTGCMRQMYAMQRVLGAFTRRYILLGRYPETCFAV